MEAEELRIGNRLLLGVVPVRIEGIHQQTKTDGKSGERTWHVYVSNFVMKDNYFCAGSDDLQPIPLSPEILGKCGFAEGNEHWELNGVKLWHDGIGFYHINSEMLIHLDHLHQLQNWYYFNVKEEINYQP